MSTSAALTPQTKVLDVGVTSADVARDLALRGITRYLGLAPVDALPALSSDAGALANRFHELTSPQTALRAAADLLILRAPHERVLWAARDLGHVRFVAVEKAAGSHAAERAAASFVARWTGKLSSRGAVRLGGRSFELLEVRHRSAPSPRRYFSPVWGAEGLAHRLAAAGLDYVVLRWFDSLPAMEPGEDLDVLVADDDLAAFRALLEEEPGTIPVDLYSASGLPYSDYQEAAYYPPALARRILTDAQRHESGFRVPGPLDHLHSLAYHAVYHKGPRSGIESVRGPSEPEPEHDYARVLGELAAEHGVEPPVTLEGWDDYLDSVGWRPSPDALRKLAPANPWIRARPEPDHGKLPDADDGQAPEVGDLAVFLVREETLTVIGLTEVLGVLEHFGFDVLVRQELSGPARRRCEAAIRGGNWGPGPYPRSGGPPAVLVVAAHYAPGALWDEIRSRYPHLTNADVLGVKLRLRDLVASRVPADRTFNPVHSADNDDEAWEYLAAAAPELLPEVRAALAERRSHLDVEVPVRQRLSRGRRARVDVVEGSDGPVVRKTYAPGFARHLEREVRVMRALNGKVAAVPPVLDRGPNWFTSPYYGNTLGELVPSRLLPLPVLRDMVAVLRELHGHGYDLVDAKPQNFLVDPEAGLKVVDFEFTHEYGDAVRPSLESSMNFAGAAPEFEGDVPVGDQSYERLWLPYTGLPREVLVDGSAAAQRAHRLLFRTRQATIAPGSAPRRRLGKARRSARHLRWLTGRHFARWADQRAGTAGTAP